MPESSAPSFLFRLILTLILTIALVWALSTFLDRFFELQGGLKGFVIVGSILAILNMIVRPILNLLTLPFRLLAGIIAIIIVNGGILWFTVWIVDRIDIDLVSLSIEGGVIGWIVLTIILGLASWMMKSIVR